MKPKRNKFGVRTDAAGKIRRTLVIDGKPVVFHSAAERDYAAWLQSKKQFFERQPKYDLRVKGEHICFYIPDFVVYWQSQHDRPRVEIIDVKGHRTEVYRIKAKLFQALYPNKAFREISAKEVARLMREG